MKKILLTVTLVVGLGNIPETAQARYYRRRSSSAPIKGLFGGALGGAALGGIFGGKRGAGIGAGVGAATGLLSGIAANRRDGGYDDEYYYEDGNNEYDY